MRTIHLSRAALEPWAILPQSLSVIVEIVTRHFAGEKLDADEVQERIHGRKRPESRVLSAEEFFAGNAQGVGIDQRGVSRGVRKVAVLPLFGTIFPRANLFTEISGATSAEMFGKQFVKLMDDPEIGAIVMDVDSPGGQAPGIMELSSLIYEARGKKPVIAVANYMMASAAYWVGSAADEIVVTPSGEVGSIGCFALHEDISGAMEKEGVKITLAREGKYKAEFNPYEPLGEEARAELQRLVRDVYDQFVGAVARNRDRSVETVVRDYGEGRMLQAKQAVQMGLADRIATLDEVISELFDGTWPRRAAQSAAVKDTIELSGEMIVPPGKKDDDFEVITTEAATRDAEEVDNRDEEAQNLRNYLDIFGPMKGGE